MDYQQTLDYLFAQLPMYQRQGKAAYKADLNNTIALMDYLGHPENGFKSIHVGGTNGKGSVSHMLAAILQEQGYKVGLYTSPHLKDFRERIRINGEMITKEAVVSFVEKHRSWMEDHSISFFEWTVGLAFEHFTNQEVDIAIIEVGMGGRLDSTNVIEPELSVITNIGLDHTQFLGDTHAKIASEKAGIIKLGVPVVIGSTLPDTKTVFAEKAAECGAPITYAEDMDTPSYSCDLIGSYQAENKRTAMTAIDILRSAGWEVSEEAIVNGFKNVSRTTGLLGRWQVLGHVPFIVCDTAHNREGLSYTMKQLAATPHNNLHIVFGVVNDKNLSDIIDLLPKNAAYYCCAANIARALPTDKLVSELRANNFECAGFESVQNALEAARSRAANNDVIYIGGSTFVVAEIL